MQVFFLVVGGAVLLLFVLSLARQSFLTGYHGYGQPFKWNGFADIFKSAGKPVGRPNRHHYQARKQTRRDFDDTFPASSNRSSSSLTDDMIATGVGIAAGATGIAMSGNLQINGVELFNTGSFDDAVQFDTMCDTNYSGMNGGTDSWNSCGSTGIDM